MFSRSAEAWQEYHKMFLLGTSSSQKDCGDRFYGYFKKWDHVYPLKIGKGFSRWMYQKNCDKLITEDIWILQILQ